MFQTDLWVKEGDKVSSFNGANDAIGTLVLKFDSEKELVYTLAHQTDYINVVIK